MKIGIYAGTFDPLTIGHQWMIEEGSKLFDLLYVSIGKNPKKDPLFSIEERKIMLEEMAYNFNNIITDVYPNLYLIDYARKIKSSTLDNPETYLLRGIRNFQDFEFESQYHRFHEKKDSSIKTIYLIPPKELVDVSSSYVKNLIGPRGWEDEIKENVSRDVHLKLLEKFKDGN